MTVKKANIKKAVAPKAQVVEQMPNGNMDVSVDAVTGIVTITINPKWNLGLSSTKKNLMIASAGAPRRVTLADGRIAKLGLNFFTEAPANKAFD